MMLYLTGSEVSIADSANAPQPDAFLSIGGNVSSTPVPNGEINGLFDLVSSYGLERKNPETIGLALINKFDDTVFDVRIKTVVSKDRLCKFKIAAERIGDNMCMEALPNRYAEPNGCEFFDSDFEIPSVDMTITSPASQGEEIAVIPLNISFVVEEGGYEGTWEAFEQAFSNSVDYGIEKVSEKIFRIYSKSELTISRPVDIQVISTSGFRCEMSGPLENSGPMNELVLVNIKESLKSGEAIGIWIKREFINEKRRSNEELVRRYKEKYVDQQLEKVELLITYKE